jgi:hypothetical protein
MIRISAAYAVAKLDSNNDTAVTVLLGGLRTGRLDSPRLARALGVPVTELLE